MTIRSGKLTPIARASIRTSSGPGSGAGTSSTTICSALDHPIKEAPRVEMLVLHSLPDATHHATAHVVALETLLPMTRGVKGYAFGHSGDRRPGVLGVVTQLGFQPQQIAEVLPETLLQGRSGDVAPIGRAVDVVAWGAAGNQFTPWLRPVPGDHSVAQRPIEEREDVIAHRDVEMGAPSRPLSLEQPQQDVNYRGVCPAADIREQRLRYRRRAVGAGGKPEQACFRHVV